MLKKRVLKDVADIEVSREEIEFADELAEEIAKLNMFIQIPSSVTKTEIFRKEFLQIAGSRAYRLAFLGLPVIDDLFSRSSVLIHIVGPEDLRHSDIMTLSRLKETEEGEMYAGMYSAYSVSLVLNRAGSLVVPGSRVVLVEDVFSELGCQGVYDYLRLKILMQMHELYDHLLVSYAEQQPEEDDEEVVEESLGTVVELPQRFTTTREFRARAERNNQHVFENQTVIPVKPKELQDRVLTFRALSGKIDLPSLTSGKIKRSLHKLGCEVVRQSGSHEILRGPNGRKMSLPQHGTRIVGIGIVYKLLKQFDLTKEEFVANL